MEEQEGEKKKMKIDYCIKEFIVDCQIRSYTPRTIRSYKNRLGQFKDFCDGINVSDMDDVNPAVVKAYSKSFMDRGCKATTVNGALKVLRTFLNYCVEEEYSNFDLRKIKYLREEKPVIKAFNRKQVNMLLQACRGNTFLDIRDLCIITLWLETGIRCLESCHLKPEHIHDEYIEVVNGKNQKSRVISISPHLKKAMLRYDRVRDSYFYGKGVHPEDYYFLSYRGKMMTVASMEFMLKKRGEGIEGVRVSPHTCRHTCAHAMLKAGVDIYTVSRMLGHENIQITSIYLRGLQDDEILKMAKQTSTLSCL